MSKSIDKISVLDSIPLRALAFATMLAAGFAITLTVDEVHHSEGRGLQILASMSLVKVFGIVIVGTILLVLLIKYAEVALAFFFLVGMFKGDPRLSSTPVDLTILAGALVGLAVALRLIASRPALSVPSADLLDGFEPVLYTGFFRRIREDSAFRLPDWPWRCGSICPLRFASEDTPVHDHNGRWRDTAGREFAFHAGRPGTTGSA